MKTKHPIIDRAYVSLVCDHPFWSTLLLNLEKVVDKGATMWTDGKRLGYCPDFCEKIGKDETIGVLAHEAAHVFLKHPIRRGHRDPHLWNIACDHVVNALILKAGFKLPAGGVPPIHDKTAEQVYDDLVKNQPLPNANPNCHGNGDGNGNPSNGNGTPDPSDGGQGKGKQKGQGWGEVRDQKNEDGSSMSDSEREAADKEANVLIKQAATAAKRAGKMPAGMDQVIEEITEPKVDWRNVLQRFIGERARSDYSWQRPNSRFFSRGIVLPSLDSHGIGKVVLAGDTSGSMTNILPAVFSEIVAALEVYEEQQTNGITVMWCDTELTEQLVSDVSDLKPVGGGGTSFAPVFKAVKTRHGDAKAVVYITDGYCDTFGEEPPCPVLWALTERNRLFKPPFGEVLVIGE
jgi:predicted metal-dependent peptidase